MRKSLLVLVCLCSLVAAAQAPAPGKSAAGLPGQETADVSGTWRGVWTDPSGFVFSAEMTLTAGSSCKMCAVIGNGSIRGQIVWTLRKAGKNAGALAGEVGLTGTEYVQGQMAGDGFFVLEGYRKDDPNNIIGLDKYRLALAENGNVIGGITRDNGPWTGQFIAVREQ